MAVQCERKFQSMFQSLYRQRRIALRSIVHQHIGPTILSHGLFDEGHRFFPHLWQHSHDLVVGRRPFDGCVMAHVERREQAYDGERRGEMLIHSCVLV